MTPNIADQIIATLHARIDELVAHVETLHYEVDAIPAIKEERDALAAAAKMALDALEGSTKYFNIVRLGESRLKDSEVRGKCHEASTALREAGVQ
jgi:hypothetical protein